MHVQDLISKNSGGRRNHAWKAFSILKECNDRMWLLSDGRDTLHMPRVSDGMLTAVSNDMLMPIARCMHTIHVVHMNLTKYTS